MAVTIEIKKPGEGSFTDRSASVRSGSVSIRQAVTKEVDSARFAVDKFGGKAFKPEPEDEIVVKQDGVKVFAGFVVRVRERVLQGPLLIYEAECRDYTHLLDRKLVNKSYSSTTVAAIIENIVAEFAGPGITTANVVGPQSVDVVTFDNLEPSKCIQKIAEIFNQDWYIDYDRDLHFFSKLSQPAPFQLTDTNGKHVFGSLEIVRDTTQIKNSILVEGAEELSSSPLTERFVGNGEQHTFALAYKYSGVSLEVDGDPKTVGIDNIDDFSTKDALYNFEGRTLRFDPASPPAEGVVIEFTGNYYFPIVTRIPAPTSIAQYGERQFRIVDNKIRDRNVAKERAKAEIYAYAARLTEGGFETDEQGLRAGMRIRIKSDLRGLDEDFLIQSLEGRMATPSRFTWRASIVSMKTYEIIDLLAQIVSKEGVEVDPNQAVNDAILITRTIGVGRTATIRSALDVVRALEVGREHAEFFDSPPIWMAGPYTPTSFPGDRKRPLFADRGCILAS